ncbi:MAG TPA: response regulator [Thermoanaerobaculia bacterium]|nr:response regulator [Thermoanaerobaculia bacterium]
MSLGGGVPDVLIVEDEAMLRELSREILEAAGYEVRVADAAETAFALAAERPPRLLITDFEMPGLCGKALAEQLRNRHPEMSVLFVSGHPQQEVLGPGALGQRTAFLQKPYSRDALLQAVVRAVALRD